VTTRRLLITGRVQGVGFRDFVLVEAERLGLAGWVRNRRDGVVEVLVHGDVMAIEALLDACRRGPPHARVTGIEQQPAEQIPEVGFRRLPTA
jgi:acylphosphatase